MATPSLAVGDSGAVPFSNYLPDSLGYKPFLSFSFSLPKAICSSSFLAVFIWRPDLSLVIMAFIIKSIFFFASFVPQIVNQSSGGSSSEPDVGGKTFDYVIVGGGLTGLTVANRLSEDPSRE